MPKFVFVTGGVVSSLGKGISAASLGTTLKARGLSVSLQKLDPYINVDPGTMSPYQHGEVFVTDDGAETDLDLGHYERFVDENLTQASNVTTGKVYLEVIQKERQGAYLGGTVQVIPHITNEIKDRILRVAALNQPDVVIVEVGGTVGDIESLPFLEAIRQLRNDIGRDNVFNVHVTLVPFLRGEEFKSKPTQHSVQALRAIGIQPDAIICRCEREATSEVRDKIAGFCDVEPGAVVMMPDARSIYEVPLMLESAGLPHHLVRRLGLGGGLPELGEWQTLVERIHNPQGQLSIALVGKYVALPDAYMSVTESMRHAGFWHNVDIEIRWIDSETLESGDLGALADVDGIVVPGGFGFRGVEGKIIAARYAREHNIPYLGLCLGLQCAVIGVAREALAGDDANSTEFNAFTPHPVIDLMPEQRDVTNKGGTMRLGLYPCKLLPGSRAHAAYRGELVYERHRHRFEVNNNYREQLQSQGMVFSGTSPNDRLVEIVEMRDHIFFVATQFHPEFKSRPNTPHPLFRDFVRASIDYSGIDQEVLEFRSEAAQRALPRTQGGADRAARPAG
ncbi:MAG: CTP synthase [Candidatus Dormibacteria bacterium]